jgi:large subunit ribosomal protein L24
MRGKKLKPQSMKHQPMGIKKGDTVVVVSGKNVGQTGEVLSIVPKKNKVVVQGVNMITRHTKPVQQHGKGSLVKKEAPIHRSNIMLYCPTSKKGVRVGSKVLENGEKVRISRKTGEQVGQI